MSRYRTNTARLLSRILLPLLIVALPIAAMIAFILYHHQKPHLAQVAEHPLDQPTFGGQAWPTIRGDSAMTGAASGSLPSKLKPAWTFQTGGAIKSAPLAAEGLVFAASEDKGLYALGVLDGKLVWRFEADDPLEAGPLWADGRVLIGSNKGTFYALDAANGRPLWQFDAGGQIAGAANAAIDPNGRALVLLGSYDSNLYALDAKTGQKVFAREAGSYINGSPAIAQGIAVFGSCDGFVHTVPLDGRQSARSIDAGSYVAAGPAIRDSVMYVGSYEGVFTAADIQTGKILWRHSSKEDDAFFSSPAVNDMYAVVGCRDHRLYCFDRDKGTLLWTFEAADDFDSSPVICGDKIAVGNNDGRLYIVDLRSGKEVFSYTLGSPVVSSPAVAQNKLFIGCDNGLLFAFEAAL
ncbi:MAG: PQQ-binding-like beta-propeller repeat protein [Planctomycetaceae bacterium]|nr:PQQ-binding-like beta-propeller repeat protein [Planctomycetaceae bacterium]